MDKKIGNELIAEFLGYQKAHYSEDKEELEFDTDWNDLMHVVEVCFDTEMEVYSYHKAIEDALISNDKEHRKHNVWIACIRLIQDVNKRK
jgi:hypothetical protein